VLALRRPELYGKGALKLSVVIPTSTKKEASLRRLLDWLLPFPNVQEVVVSGGGGNFRPRYPDGGPLGRRLKWLAPVYRRGPRYR
jgi:hypothetical protein